MIRLNRKQYTPVDPEKAALMEDFRNRKRSRVSHLQRHSISFGAVQPSFISAVVFRVRVSEACYYDR